MATTWIETETQTANTHDTSGESPMQMFKGEIPDRCKRANWYPDVEASIVDMLIDEYEYSGEVSVADWFDSDRTRLLSLASDLLAEFEPEMAEDFADLTVRVVIRKVESGRYSEYFPEPPQAIALNQVNWKEEGF